MSRSDTATPPTPAGPSSPVASLPGVVPLVPSMTKIQDRHRARLAIVYVRQSSPQQVLQHRESAARQYALADRVRALGWPADRVLVIDEDQGQSGKTAEGRSGFQRLVDEVTMSH